VCECVCGPHYANHNFVFVSLCLLLFIDICFTTHPQPPSAEIASKPIEHMPWKVGYKILETENYGKLCEAIENVKYRFVACGSQSKR